MCVSGMQDVAWIPKPENLGICAGERRPDGEIGRREDFDGRITTTVHQEDEACWQGILLLRLGPPPHTPKLCRNRRIMTGHKHDS